MRLALTFLLLLVLGCSVDLGGGYSLNSVVLSKSSVTPPDSMTCTMDYTGSSSLPDSSSCVVRNATSEEWNGCTGLTPSGNAFACVIDFDSTYIPTDTSYTGGTWTINHISAFDNAGTSRLFASRSDLVADGQTVDFDLLTILWESTEQTAGYPYGFDFASCEHPIDTSGGCTNGTADGVEMDRQPVGSGWAVRHYGEFDCVQPCTDPNGVRAQGAILGAGRSNIQALFDNKSPMWFYMERYLPHDIDGSGWLNIFDIHVVDPGDSGDRLQTNPGIMLHSNAGNDNGYIDPGFPAANPTPNIIQLSWNSLTTPNSARSANPPGSSNDADVVGMPTGQWFELELMYQRSDFDVANGAAQVWIDNVLVIDQQNIITHGTNQFPGDGPYSNFEAYFKYYGGPTWTDWDPIGARIYSRNMLISGGKQSDGDPGDQTPPNIESVDLDFFASRTSCMRPCAVYLDAQRTESLSWDGGDGFGGEPGVAEGKFVWNFDDGGSAVDSDGFLAAAVYETAGQYSIGLAVDSVAWNPQTITVTDPTWEGCVCNSGSCGCANNYSTISAALTAAGAQPRHILLNRGESHGALPSGDSTQTMIGAYGSGAKPIVTASGMSLTDWRLVDLDINGTGTAVQASGAGGLVLRSDIDSSTGNGVYQPAGGNSFVIDSTVTNNATGSAYVVFIWDNVQWSVLKNSTITHSGTGNHAIRIDGDGQKGVLLQNNEVFAANAVSGITIRGATTWSLVQGNWTNRSIGSSDSEPGDPRSRANLIFDRNSWDRLGQNTSNGLGLGDCQNCVVRSNIVYNGGGTSSGNFSAGGVNNWFLNNVSDGNDTHGFQCNSESGCIVKNNICHNPTDTQWGDCFVGGGTLEKNWAYTDDECIDPVDGNSSGGGGAECYNPTFTTTTCGTRTNGRCQTGFFEPTHTRGTNIGASAGVHYDYNDTEIVSLDVGAVEVTP